MAEYIEREALLSIYKKWIPQLALPEDEGDKRGVETCIAVLEDAPAADVVERKRGEWVKNDDNVWWEGSETRFCSCCGQGINVECIPWFKFCPNCGAKMDGGTQHEQS